MKLRLRGHVQPSWDGCSEMNAVSGTEVDLLNEEEFWPSENSEEQRGGGSDGEKVGEKME